MAKRHRSVSDADWNQLITLASGYLALESGDIQAAMRRALAAHVDLISALKSGAIQAEVARGTVTMFVPPEGGVALRMEKPSEPPDASDDPTVVAEPVKRRPIHDLSDSPTDAQFDGGSTFVLDEDD